MFTLHVNEDRQTVLPEQLCAWLGVAPGEDLMVSIAEPGAIKLIPKRNGFGRLANYTMPKKGDPYDRVAEARKKVAARLAEEEKMLATQR